MIHPKIIASIKSCETYEQIETCKNFMNCYPNNITASLLILGMMQERAYEMRNDDIKDHVEKLKQIFN